MTYIEPLMRMGEIKELSIVSLVKCFWWIARLVLLPLQWILSIDCFLQLIRMIHHWSTPGVYAGWTFLFHFALLVVLTQIILFCNSKKV
jgi:hypothetical protein